MTITSEDIAFAIRISGLSGPHFEEGDNLYCGSNTFPEHRVTVTRTAIREFFADLIARQSWVEADHG